MVCCCRCLEEGAQAQVMWTITEKDDMIPEGKRRNLVGFFHHISTWILTRAFPLFFFFFSLRFVLSYVNHFLLQAYCTYHYKTQERNNNFSSENIFQAVSLLKLLLSAWISSNMTQWSVMMNGGKECNPTYFHEFIIWSLLVINKFI